MKKSVTLILVLLILAAAGMWWKNRADKARVENDGYYSAVMCVIVQRLGSDTSPEAYLRDFNTVIEGGNSFYALDRKSLDRDEARRVIAAFQGLPEADKARAVQQDSACRASLMAALAK
ncbi:hypothetical protein [Nissabacter sp. SGAir0207]|uniref:hypothetical protein n=1 Tax=Nissabacter sp. SGAir0207 TaxID=2126321 RepID=UPI0010CD21E8|nr:hypothetical protein [Nissabacter sp. SGAir0207]QCR38333.1 hypothetical protein C1N62_19510 [Nissabacter sp. SGAir0207]